MDIKSLKSINSELGLSRVGGDLETYEIILQDYLNSYATTVSQIDKLLISGDWEELHRVVHTFKGVSGSIGAEKLYEISLKIETEVKNRHLINSSPLIMVLDKELAIVIEELTKLYSQSNVRELSFNDLIEQVSLLKSMLDEKRYKEAKNLVNSWGSSEDLIPIITATRNYKIKAAIQLCNNLLMPGSIDG